MNMMAHVQATIQRSWLRALASLFCTTCNHVKDITAFADNMRNPEDLHHHCTDWDCRPDRMPNARINIDGVPHGWCYACHNVDTTYNMQILVGDRDWWDRACPALVL